MLDSDYISMLVCAPVIFDSIDYNLAAGEMNPEIFSRYVDMAKIASANPVIWEPFAGTSCQGSNPRGVIQDIAERKGVRLISYGLAPKDSRITHADSVRIGPKATLDGALFHPPYFGSGLMSDDDSDLSRIRSFSEYQSAIGVVVWRIAEAMSKGGSVCAVGRDYRVYGERIRLDLTYLDIFGRAGFELNEVWRSLPDIVLIFGRKI